MLMSFETWSLHQDKARNNKYDSKFKLSTDLWQEEKCSYLDFEKPLLIYFFDPKQFLFPMEDHFS